jgi:hypothetical protein
MIQLCCVRMKNWWRRHPSKGMGVYATLSMLGEYEISIFSIPADSADIKKIQSSQSDQPVSISTFMSFPIKFCPWCGTDLKIIIKNQSSEFMKEVENSKDWDPFR